MKKIEEAKKILEEFGLPKTWQNNRSALILLALCNLPENGNWKNAKMISMSVVGNKNNPKYPGIMRFIKDKFNEEYADYPGVSFRRQTLHQLVQAGIVDHNPENRLLPTNSKDNHYRLTEEALTVIQAFNTKKWNTALNAFKNEHGTLKEKYNKERQYGLLPLSIADGKQISLSPGKHNEIQIAVLKEYAPRFAPGCELLYIGDTAKKDLFFDTERFSAIGIKLTIHEKLPDIVLYDSNRNWLYLIEVATSHGPVTPKRIIELNELTHGCKAGIIFVSVFPDFNTFKKFTKDIAWETEVWIAEDETYSHLIHFNGDRFLGPR